MRMEGGAIAMTLPLVLVALFAVVGATCGILVRLGLRSQKLADPPYRKARMIYAIGMIICFACAAVIGTIKHSSPIENRFGWIGVVAAFAAFFVALASSRR